MEIVHSKNRIFIPHYSDELHNVWDGLEDHSIQLLKYNEINEVLSIILDTCTIFDTSKKVMNYILSALYIKKV